MESRWHAKRIRSGLPFTTHLLNNGGQVGFKADHKLDDFVEPAFNCIQPRLQRCRIRAHLAASCRLLCTTFEDRIKALWLPAESHRQRFQRSPAAAALHGVPLYFSHNGHRDMRALRKLTLTPAELTHALADSPCDRSPILRHAFRHASASRVHFQRRD
jgi:hypothetical protein